MSSNVNMKTVTFLNQNRLNQLPLVFNDIVTAELLAVNIQKLFWTKNVSTVVIGAGSRLGILR